jgi:hypothetical protein
MAEDVICLLDYLGWTADRELNIVGMSLGGMIAQGQWIPDIFAARFMRSKLDSEYIELAYRIPNRISSLLLAVTTPGGPWGGHIFGKFPVRAPVLPCSNSLKLNI